MASLQPRCAGPTPRLARPLQQAKRLTGRRQQGRSLALRAVAEGSTGVKGSRHPPSNVVVKTMLGEGSFGTVFEVGCALPRAAQFAFRVASPGAKHPNTSACCAKDAWYFVIPPRARFGTVWAASKSRWFHPRGLPSHAGYA